MYSGDYFFNTENCELFCKITKKKKNIFNIRENRSKGEIYLPHLSVWPPLGVTKTQNLTKAVICRRTR